MQKYRWDPPLIAIHTHKHALLYHHHGLIHSHPHKHHTHTGCRPYYSVTHSSTPAPTTDPLPFVSEKSAAILHPERTVQAAFPTKFSYSNWYFQLVLPILRQSSISLPMMRKAEQNRTQKISLEGTRHRTFITKTRFSAVDPLGRVYMTLR